MAHSLQTADTYYTYAPTNKESLNIRSYFEKAIMSGGDSEHQDKGEQGEGESTPPSSPATPTQQAAAAHGEEGEHESEQGEGESNSPSTSATPTKQAAAAPSTSATPTQQAKKTVNYSPFKDYKKMLRVSKAVTQMVKKRSFRK